MRRFVRLNRSILSLAVLGAACGLMTNPAAAQQAAQPGAQTRGTFAAQGAQAAQGQYPAAQNPPRQVSQGQLTQAQLTQAQQAQAQQAQAQQAPAQQATAQQAQGLPGQAGVGQNAAALALGNAAGVPVVQGDGAVNPVSPFPPLNEQWQAYLDKVLTAWEKKSGEVTRYACKFRRWQYDPSLVQNSAYTIADGVVKYMQPDKGLFRVDELVYYSGTKDNKPDYRENKQKKFGEYWICDGKYVHILDQNEKKCVKHELPPQMRGNAIYLSPLPFLFGVKADEIKKRYWIRPLPLPEDRKNEIWLEAYPRRADDAANYQRVQVVLDVSDLMPKGLIVFLPNWRPEAKHSELYEFNDRQVNENLLQRLNIFQQEFIPAEPPKDWTVIVEPFQPQQAAPPSSEPRVAAPPATGVPVR